MHPADLPASALAMVATRALATLTTMRGNGTPHVVPVGFTYDPSEQVIRVISGDGTQKVRNADRLTRAVVCQVDGGFWISLEGSIRVSRQPDEVADAAARYASKYQTPRENPKRVALILTVDRILGRFPADS